MDAVILPDERGTGFGRGGMWVDYLCKPEPGGIDAWTGGGARSTRCSTTDTRRRQLP